MPKRKQPTTKTMEDETEQDTKNSEPQLKQTKKTAGTEDRKSAPIKEGKEEESRTPPKKETQTPQKEKIEEEKSAGKGRRNSKLNGKSNPEREEETEKPVKKVVNKGKRVQDKKDEEKQESPEKGRSKKSDKETGEKKGRSRSKTSKDDDEEKVIVKKISGGGDGEGGVTVTAKIPHNPKKLTRDRSSIENILDDYEHNTRAIALGDGKIESKEILISSWNVNGLNALLKKDNLHGYMKEKQPEIICLNEIKLTDANCEEIGTKWIPDGYNGYFNCCKVKKGYAGVAIVSKHKPISVKFDLGIKKHDLEGRTITVEFEHFFLVSCYVPNSGDGLVGLSYRTQEWDPDLREYLGELKKKKHVILCGDLNCAHKEIDIYEPKGHEKSACFTPQERREFGNLLDSGFVDTFRHFYPEEQKFSFFSVRFNHRANNKGWRLDYFLVDKEGMTSIKDSTINDKIFGSDHLPIELTFNPNFDS